MTYTTSTDKQTEKAKDLLQQGYIAYNNWEIKKARLLWRKGAVNDPANEEIWWALLKVLETDEDRRVCLQNILVLNPENQEAEKRLRLLEEETQPTPPPEPLPDTLQVLRPELQETIGRLLSWLFTGLVVIFVSVVIAAMIVQPLV